MSKIKKHYGPGELPTVVVKHVSETLTAANGNKYNILTVETDWEGTIQITKIAFFLPKNK